MANKKFMEFLKKGYYIERTAKDMNLGEYESLITEMNSAWASATPVDKDKFRRFRYYGTILLDVIMYKRKNDYFRVVKNFANSSQALENIVSLIGDITQMRSRDLAQLERYEKSFGQAKLEKYTSKVDYFSTLIGHLFLIGEAFYMAEDLDPEAYDEQATFNDAKFQILEIYEVMAQQYFNDEL